MADRTPEERLEELLEGMLKDPRARIPGIDDPELAGMLLVAADLRGLPAEGFRERLRHELEVAALEAGSGISRPPSGAREGFHSLTPYLQVQRPAAVLEFVKEAFGATETLRVMAPGGGMHAEARLGDSMLMLGGAEGMAFPEMPTALHLYVPDADLFYDRALAAGARSLQAPTDQPYGDREAGVEDPGGNHWYIATHKLAGEGRHVPEGLRDVTLYLHPRGAPALIDFLTEAFGAEEISRHAGADGVVHHATVRIGDSVVEMGEAHGEIRPMPAAIYLYVEDVDAVYARAVRAGGTEAEPPTDRPYGDRSAYVADPFGNMWYIATHQGRVAS